MGNDEILFLFLYLDMVLRNSIPGGFAYIWLSKCIEIIAIKTERRQIYFLSPFSLPSRPRILKSLVAVVCDHTKRTQQMLSDD